MRFLCCHIENFGKLHDFDADFTGNLNVICEENGWGKSTFAAFVRAMFYGLEGGRKKDILQNERVRYAPWQGGNFGGELTFSVGDKEYTVTRYFKDKEANDFFELRNTLTNLVSKDYGPKLGEELFQIDKESFGRTFFIDQNVGFPYVTDDIHTKIGDFTDVTNDMDHYEKAMERLHEAMNHLTPDRRTGSIKKRIGVIEELERMVRDGSRSEERLQQQGLLILEEQQNIEKYKKELEDLRRRRTELVRIQQHLAKKDRWQQLLEEVRSKQEKLSHRQAFFPGEIPSKEKIDHAIKNLGEAELSKREALSNALSAEELTKWEEGNELFARHPEDADKLEEMIEAALFLQEEKSKRSGDALSIADKQRLTELSAEFENETDSVEDYAGRWKEAADVKSQLISARKELVNLSADLEQKKQNAASKKKLSLILMILGGVIMLLGVLGILGISVAVGIFAVIPGIVVLVAGIVLKSSINTALLAAQEDMCKNLEDEIAGYEEYQDRVTEDITYYLNKHGKTFHDEYRVEIQLQEILGKRSEYENLKRKEAACSEEKDQKPVAEKERIVRSFLAGFGWDPEEFEYLDRLYYLKEIRSGFKELDRRKRTCETAEGNQRAQLKQVQIFLDTYGFPPSEDLQMQLEEIKDRADEVNDSLELYGEAKEKLRDFEENNDIQVFEHLENAESSTAEELETLERDLIEQKEEADSRLKEADRVNEELLEAFEEWMNNRERLEEEKAILEREKCVYGRLEKTAKHLEAAKEALTAQYATPLKESFGKYYGILTGKAADDFMIDANTRITKKEQGLQREFDTFSTGSRDLISICLRMALADAMYREEKPVLILDDPFVNLDDEKTQAAMNFLERVSEEYQILYFTCSKIRAGK